MEYLFRLAVDGFSELIECASCHIPNRVAQTTTLTFGFLMWCCCWYNGGVTTAHSHLFGSGVCIYPGDTKDRI